LEKWLKEIDDAVRNRNARLALHIKHKGRAGTSYTDRITRAHPTYLHEMYRQATSLLGDDATFEETAAIMNLQSTGLEGLPTLTLNKLSLYWWFKKNKGAERRTVERPLLSEEHKQARL